MIYEFDVKDPKKTTVPWFAKVEALSKPRTFEFKPGLNIVWGRNGAGKTTLTKAIARLFHCEQGNRPVVTEESLRELVSASNMIDTPTLAVEAKHDGQGVRYFDPGAAVGLIGGNAGFDWDFGTEGIDNMMFKGSSGQTTMRRFDRILNEIVAGEVPEVEWKVSRKHVNSFWEARCDFAAGFLKKNAKKGQPTILLDEPERSYDLNAQIGVWRLLRAYSSDVQFIVASHSFFALKIPGANYIDLSPGYLPQCEDIALRLLAWPAEEPKKVPESEAAKIREHLKKQRRSQ